MNESTFSEVSEISISYKPDVPVNRRPQIRCSRDIYDLMMKVVDNDIISHHEEFWIVLMNRGNRVLGVAKIAQGGICTASIDIRIIFQYALKTNAVGLALVHNHPSNELRPSTQDIKLTERVVSLCKMLDITVIDHLIITSENGYYSFADEGILTD